MESTIPSGPRVVTARLVLSVLVALAATFVGGCSEDSGRSAKPAPAETGAAPSAPEPAAPPPRPAAEAPEPPSAPAARNGDRAPEMARERALASVRESERAIAPPARDTVRLRSARERPETAASAPAASALDADQERMRLRDEYISGLSQAAYTFNPPSPIKVAQPITVALWVDPATSAARLAEEMKKAFPESAARVESGETKWSPRMRATLTGPDFQITPVEGKDFDGVKDLSATARTEWSWSVRPTSPGKKKLHLLLAVVLPPELGKPRDLPQISRDIEVEVTIWWLIDNFWEKYWKWLLGGLGGAAGAAIAYWWKNRRRRDGQA